MYSSIILCVYEHCLLQLGCAVKNSRKSALVEGFSMHARSTPGLATPERAGLVRTHPAASAVGVVPGRRRPRARLHSLSPQSRLSDRLES
jgi:hypothetical protein